MQPIRGVVAGDAQANSLAKAILYHILRRVSSTPGAANSETYVYDLKQTSHNESRDLVIRQAVDSAIQIYECLQAENFVMSGKNDITVTHPRTRAIVLHHLKQSNVSANIPDEARHLGLGNRAGRGASRVIKKARFLNS